MLLFPSRWSAVLCATTPAMVRMMPVARISQWTACRSVTGPRSAVMVSDIARVGCAGSVWGACSISSAHSARALRSSGSSPCHLPDHFDGFVVGQQVGYVVLGRDVGQLAAAMVVHGVSHH